jgi:hypothetical protein
MDVISWHLVLWNILPTYLIIAFSFSLCGIIAKFCLPGFQIRKGAFAFILVMMLIVVFFGMVALAELRVHFPGFEGYLLFNKPIGYLGA